MKYFLLLCAALFFATPVSAQSHASSVGKTVTVPITSKEELNRYLKSKTPTFLDMLPSDAKEDFVKDVKFNETGVADFSLSALAPLTSAEKKIFLSHFGSKNQRVALEDLKFDTSSLKQQRQLKDEGACALNMSSFEQQLNEIEQWHVSIDYNQSIRSRYLAAFEVFKELYKNKDVPACLSGANQKALYSSLFNFLLNTESEEAFSLVETIWNEFDPALQKEKAESYHRLLLMLNKDKRAAQLREQYTDIATPLDNPAAKLTGPNRHYALYSPESAAFTPKSVDFDNFTGFVILSHPGCGFSRNAWQNIRKDEELSSVLLSKDAIWLNSAWMDRNPKAIQYIHNLQKDMPIGLVAKESDWPELTYWGTPAFYAFRNGVLIESKAGWIKGEEDKSMAELRRLAQMIK